MVLWVLVVSTAACVRSEECPPNTACVEPRKTMYYRETPGVEPWAADASGAGPSDWMRRALEDISGRGLELGVIGRVPVPNSPGSYAVQVSVRPKDEAAASARCFVETLSDPRPPAAERSDCAPLHTAR